jgi:2-oxoglutarate dehydrogenase E2 component (dihydrolipoamide succinyltransferase)
MPVELVVPSVGESITQVEIGDWLKTPGDAVAQDEPVVVIETDKVTVELPAPTSGTITKMLKKKGEKAAVGDVIGYMEPNGASSSTPPQLRRGGAPKGEPDAERKRDSAQPQGTAKPQETRRGGVEQENKSVDQHHSSRDSAPAPPSSAEEGSLESKGPPALTKSATGREQQIVPMTPIRRRIAERLVEAQKSAALLTTFNEVDMSAAIGLRQQYQQQFQAKYQIKLGFMSFFVKACIEALRAIPQLNAEVRGHDILFHNYYDIGIAIGGGKGLVVPVLRNAERLSFAEIERGIADFAQRAQSNQLKVDELQGGTFTLSNGGVYGSMLSTPIVNPPQSGVLGLHSIEDRPVARGGEVVIRPMMYLALGYDHRIVDGREAVTFLKHIKDLIENPARMLLEI